MGIKNLLVQRNRAGSSPPFLLGVRSAKWFIVSVCCVAVFTVNSPWKDLRLLVIGS